MAKATPYWHPRFPTPDGRTYCAVDRKDIAALIRDHKREKTLNTKRDTHGRRVYSFLTPLLTHETGYVVMVHQS